MIGAHRTHAVYGRKRLSGTAALTTLGDGWHRHGLRHYPAVIGPFDSSPLVRLCGGDELRVRQAWTRVVLDHAIRNAA